MSARHVQILRLVLIGAATAACIYYGRIVLGWGAWAWTSHSSAHPIPISYYQPLPPSVTDDPVAYAWSLAGLMIVTLIFMQWAHRMIWVMIDRPEPLNHPRTILRLILLGTAVSAVIRNGPNVLVWGLWKGVSPATRYWLARWDRILDGFSAPPQVASALLLIAAWAVLDWQLGKQPIPVELYPGWRKMGRPIALVSLATTIAFAIAFLQ